MKTTLLVISLALLAGCQDQPTVVDESQVLAQVGDYLVTENLVEVVANSQGIQVPSADQKQRILQDLITDLAMAHQAKVKKIQPSAKQMAMLQYQQWKLQSQLALNDYLEANPITDEMIAAEYEKVVSETRGLSFHVRHMLYKDQSDAVVALDQIIAGEKTYLQAEQDYLAAQPNMRNVGDIGWVNLKQLPGAFAQPLQRMSEGSVHPEVVVSQFGGHVLYLVEKKEAEPPSLEQTKEGIKHALQQKAINRFKQLAHAKAKIKLAQN